jgi:hypothetical protein
MTLGRRRGVPGVGTLLSCESGMQGPFRLRKAYGATGRLAPAKLFWTRPTGWRRTNYEQKRQD